MRTDPFWNAARDTADVCSAMVAWSGALCGNEDPEKAMRLIRKSAGAEAAFVFRLAGGASRLLLASPHDPAGPTSFAGALTMAAGGRLSEGSVLRAADVEAGSAPGTADMLVHRILAADLRDVALVILEVRPDHLDALELHHAAKASKDEVATLNGMAPALAAAWAQRLPGMAARFARHGSGGMPRRAEGALDPVLSAANPAGLTRSEFRVCLLVLEGLTPKAIAEALDVRLSTVYAHLRAVCAKTGTASQLELVHRLVEDERNARRHSGLFQPRAMERPVPVRPTADIGTRPRPVAR